MKIIRFKAVSECIGIRRTSVAYFPFENDKSYDVSKYEHPLNSINNIHINKACISFLGNDYDLDHTINFKLKALSLGQEVTEYCHLDIMFLDIDDLKLENYKENFDNYFDEYNGEFEFIVGYYLYLNNKKDESMEYFDKSLKKGFKLAKNYYNN